MQPNETTRPSRTATKTKAKAQSAEPRESSRKARTAPVRSHRKPRGNSPSSSVREAQPSLRNASALTPSRHSSVVATRPTASQQALFDQLLPLARQIVGGFQRRLPRNVLRDDLLGAAMAGLWDAIRKHGDQTEGNFEWYVRVRIRGAILDELRAQDWLPRRARAAAERHPTGRGAPNVIRFDEVSDSEQNRCLATPERFSAELALLKADESKTLRRAIAQLPEREQQIMTQHYFRGVKFKDLGTQLGVSEPRISQLHARAVARLRELLAEAA
ncbi:MAG: sigma-70 family RNA polymerase sigma factor [Myxococcales bacterium]|nr:sigma-70 family RNA polymerase sigma factor [Myxococcales bacterium]